jgi:hypothetical protein
MWSSRLSRNYFIIVYQRLGGNYCFRLQGGMRREVPPQRRKHIWNYMMSDDHDSNHSSVLLKSWSPSLLSYHLIFDFFLYLFFNDRFFLPFSTFRSLSLWSFPSYLFSFCYSLAHWSEVGYFYAILCPLLCFTTVLSTTYSLNDIWLRLYTLLKSLVNYFTCRCEGLGFKVSLLLWA